MKRFIYVEQLIFLTSTFDNMALDNGVNALNLTVNELQQMINEKLNKSSGFDIWILSATFNIMLMQLGFCLVETGIVAPHHTSEVLIKNLVDSCFGTVTWFCVGYALYTQKLVNLAKIPEENMVHWIWSCSFATTTATILSGGVVGRVKFKAYILYSIFSTAVIYPIAAYFCWAGPLFDMGFLDFAGGGPVHVVGGIASFTAAYAIGPRVNRFDVHKRAHRIKPASEPMLVLGTYILWFGWFFFNSSSAQNNVKYTILASINTILASSGGGIAGFFWSYLSTNGEVIELSFIANSILVSLVAITPGCAYVSPFVSLLIGALSIPALVLFSKLLIYFQIDDPADATSVHFGGGVCGLVLLGLCHRTKGLLITGSFNFFLIQVSGLIFCVFWSGFWAILFWVILGTSRINDGKISRWRSSDIEELTGLAFKTDVYYGNDKLSKYAISLHSQTNAAQKKVRNRLDQVEKAKVQKNPVRKLIVRQSVRNNRTHSGHSIVPMKPTN